MEDTQYEEWNMLTEKLHRCEHLTDSELLKLEEHLESEIKEVAGEGCDPDDLQRVLNDIRVVNFAILRRRLR